MSDDLATATRDLIGRMAPDPPAAITDDQRLIEDLGFDSIRLVELTIALERTFSLPRHDPAQLVDVLRVGDVVELVARERLAAADD